MAFHATLWTYPGKGGWTFVDVPESHAPAFAGPWGRTPVIATVDGVRFETSVWRERSGRTLLPVAKKIRGVKGAGDVVEVEIEAQEGG